LTKAQDLRKVGKAFAFGFGEFNSLLQKDLGQRLKQDVKRAVDAFKNAAVSVQPGSEQVSGAFERNSHFFLPGLEEVVTEVMSWMIREERNKETERYLGRGHCLRGKWFQREVPRIFHGPASVATVTPGFELVTEKNGSGRGKDEDYVKLYDWPRSGH
jgi:hypothetical protein